MNYYRVNKNSLIDHWRGFCSENQIEKKHVWYETAAEWLFSGESTILQIEMILVCTFGTILVGYTYCFNS